MTGCWAEFVGSPHETGRTAPAGVSAAIWFWNCPTDYLSVPLMRGVDHPGRHTRMMSVSSDSTAPVLREGRSVDTAACVELWVAACAFRDGHQYSGVAERARPKFENAAAWIVAERRPGAIVGFALATRPGSGVASDPPSAVVLGLLAVDPQEQGSGLGRELLSAITSAVAALGHMQAVLHVLAQNDSAVRLYEAAGWTSEGPTFEHSLLKRPFQTYVRDLR